MLMEDFIKNNKNTADGNYSFYCTTLCIVSIDLTKTFIDHCKDILNHLLSHCHVDCIKESEGKFPLLVFFTCFRDLMEAYHVLQLNPLFKVNFTPEKSYNSNATIRISGISMDNVKDRIMLSLLWKEEILKSLFGVVINNNNNNNDNYNKEKQFQIVRFQLEPYNGQWIALVTLVDTNVLNDELVPSSFKKNFNVKHLEKINNSKLLKEGGSINIKVISKNDRLFIINFIIECIDSFTKIIQNLESFSLDGSSVHSYLYQPYLSQYLKLSKGEIKKSILKKTNAINNLKRKRDSEHFDKEIKKVRMTILDATRTEEESITSDTTIEKDYHYEGIKEMKKEEESDVE
ncbi:hypothetical protein ABK040_014898 [Willaertia magna]